MFVLLKSLCCRKRIKSGQSAEMSTLMLQMFLKWAGAVKTSPQTLCSWNSSLFLCLDSHFLPILICFFFYFSLLLQPWPELHSFFYHCESDQVAVEDKLPHAVCTQGGNLSTGGLSVLSGTEKGECVTSLHRKRTNNQPELVFWSFGMIQTCFV